MKYDYTSKITAALDTRDLHEQHDAHEHLYTPDTLNTGMCIKSRMNSNHHRCRRRHRYHRERVINFSRTPNAIAVNHRLTIVLQDRQFAPIRGRSPHGCFTIDSQLRVKRITAIITAFVASARNADVSPRTFLQRLSHRETATIM